MYYSLDPSIALRSFWKVPFAYYRKHELKASGLSPEEFFFLCDCDSLHDLDDAALAESLQGRGLIRPCKKGEGLPSPWQKKVCDNHYFPSINWMITGKCNYNCRHCFNAADNAPLMTAFSWEEAERLMDEAEAAGINAFLLTGGEPMMHPQFFDIVRGIHSRGMYVDELNTNGYFLDEAALDRLRDIGSDPLMKISFDGLAHHDWMRMRKGAEERALDAIRLCVERGFQVMVQYNIHKGNLDTLDDTLDYLDSLGVATTRLIRTSESPRWVENDSGQTLTIKEYYDTLLAAFALYAGAGHSMSLDGWQFLTLYPAGKSYSIEAISFSRGAYTPHKPMCMGTRGRIAIGSDGEVYPCNQMSGYYKAIGKSLGNVKTDGLVPLLQQGPYLESVCTTCGDLADACSTCRDCPHFKVCGGGCRALALAITHRLMGEDPTKCYFFQNNYYDKIVEALPGWRNRTPM